MKSMELLVEGMPIQIKIYDMGDLFSIMKFSKDRTPEDIPTKIL